MQRAVLNLVALRASRSCPSSLDQDAARRGPTLSRRSVLGLASVTAAGASPVLRALESSLRGSFELVRVGKGHVVFRQAGLDRWTVDVQQFAGSPKLQLQQTPDTIRLALRGARYPGTDLPADFQCAVHRGITGWNITLEMALGGFAGTTSFVSWLLGLCTLESRIRLQQTSISLGTSASLDLGGTARATFTPDWHLAIAGKGVAAVTGLGKPLLADSAALGLLSPGAPSVLQLPSSKRTTITLWRGTRTWRLQPSFEPTGRWRLIAPPGAFDAIGFELGEGPAQQITAGVVPPIGVQPEAGFLSRPETTGSGKTAALVAEAGSGLLFQPHSGLKGTGAAVASLPLRGARYAIAFDPAGDHRSLVARFAAQPAWLKAGSCALEVGDADGAPPLELVAHGSSVTDVQCTPAMLRVSIPVAGAVAMPMTMPQGTHLAFVAKGLAQSDRPQAFQLHLADRPADAFEHLAGPSPSSDYNSDYTTLAILRPDDFLYLTFNFAGMQLQVNAGSLPEMVPLPPDYGQEPYLCVTFPAQHIAETAYFEGTPNTPIPSGSADPMPHSKVPPDSDATTPPRSSSAIPDKPPVLGYLSGLSQLSFRMPEGFTSLQLTLDNLLDWSQLEQSVSPLALPVGENYYGDATQHADLRKLFAVGAEPLQEPNNPRLTCDNTLTGLEIPYGLMISPNRYAAWIHAFTPVTHAGVTELWHTRLGVRVTVPETNGHPQYSKSVVGPDTTMQVVGKSSMSLAAKNMVSESTTLSLDNTYLSPGHTYLLDTHYAYEAQDTLDGTKYSVTQDTYSGGMPLDAAHDYRTIRAVYSAFYSDSAPAFNWPNNANDPVGKMRTSLTGEDRAQLVALTSCYLNVKKPHNDLAHQYAPMPVNANRLMLTALGAWVDFHGAWPDADHMGVALEEWTHKGTQGRDNYVRVVYKGYLFPFGHRATLIKVTERKFYSTNPGQPKIAYLFQRMFIVVREPLKQYDLSHLLDDHAKPSPLADSQGRQLARWMPFQQIQITTITTPDINKPKGMFAKSDLPKTNPPTQPYQDIDAFWPQIGSPAQPQDFLFHCIGQDWEGQRVEFMAPLAFISVDRYLAFDPTMMQVVQHLCTPTPAPTKTLQQNARNTLSMHGAKIAYAPSNRPGDTSLHTTDMSFDVYIPPEAQLQQSTLITSDEPCFIPVMAYAHVSIPAVEALLHTGQVPLIKLSDHYLREGITAKDPTGTGNNPGEVFAEIVDAAHPSTPDLTTFPKISYGSKGSNGSNSAVVVAPNLSISALSRVLGPIGGTASQIGQLATATTPTGAVKLDKDGNPTGDAGDFLSNFFAQDAKILGAIPITAIIKMPKLNSPINPLSILTAAQSLQSVPGTLSQLGSDVIDPALASLESLAAKAQAVALQALARQLAPVQATLHSVQSALPALQGLLKSFDNSSGGDVTLGLLHSGDLSDVVTALNAAASALDPLPGKLTSFVQLLSGSPVPSELTIPAKQLEDGLNVFSLSLQSALSSLSGLRGLNPLPTLQHAQLPDAVEVHLKWAPNVGTYNFGIVSFTPGAGDDGDADNSNDDKFLSVSADIRMPLTGSDSSTFSLKGVLGAFRVELADMIEIKFTGITFSASNGSKPDVTAPGLTVEPKGDLAFVYDLMKIIPGTGLSDPPYVDISDDGIEVGFSIDVPSLSMGMFSIENISLGASAKMPWIGSSPVQIAFNFCTRENPFHLSVCMFGGGGYFIVTMGMDGLQALEAGLDFTGGMSLNCGIASASVSLSASIYFQLNMGTPQTTKLGGNVQIGGSLCVFGVSVSIEVSLTLEYEDDGGRSFATGEAKLQISVDLGCFSIPIPPVDVRKKFGGNDPRFRDQLKPKNWNAYWKAFDPEYLRAV